MIAGNFRKTTQGKIALMSLGFGDFMAELYGEGFEIFECDIDANFDDIANLVNVTFSDDDEREEVKAALKSMCDS